MYFVFFMGSRLNCRQGGEVVYASCVYPARKEPFALMLELYQQTSQHRQRQISCP